MQSFFFSAETVHPDASSAVLVTRTGYEAGIQLISPDPRIFGATNWLKPVEIRGEKLRLLPDKVSTITPDQIAEVEELIVLNQGKRLERRGQS